MTKPVTPISRPLRLFEVWPGGKKPGRSDALHLRIYHAKNVASLMRLTIPKSIQHLFWEWVLADPTYRWYVPRFPTQQAIGVLTDTAGSVSESTYTLPWELIRRRERVHLFWNNQEIGYVPHDDLRAICMASHHQHKSAFG